MGRKEHIGNSMYGYINWTLVTRASWSEEYGDENPECKSCDTASYLGHFGQVNQSGYVSSPVKGDNAYVTKP